MSDEKLEEIVQGSERLPEQEGETEAEPEAEEASAQEEFEEITPGKLIDKYLHGILDIEDCASEYIAVAVKKYEKETDRLIKEITDKSEKLNTPEQGKLDIHALKELRRSFKEIDRHSNSAPARTLSKSLFINLFATFDMFLGELVSCLYRLNKDLYKNIKREIPLSEALLFESIDELKQAVLDKEIENLKRKSYKDQFKEMEERFNISLTKFDAFVP